MEALLEVLRLLADGVIGPRVHELLDQIEAGGHAPAAPAPQVPSLTPVPIPFGGTK